MDINLLSLKQAAKLLGVSTEAVRRLCERGTLAFTEIDGRKFVRRVELERRIALFGAESVTR